MKGQEILYYWKRLKHVYELTEEDKVLMEEEGIEEPPPVSVKDFSTSLHSFTKKELDDLVTFGKKPAINPIIIGDPNAGITASFISQDNHIWPHTHDFIEKELTDADKGALMVAPILSAVQTTYKDLDGFNSGKIRHTKKFSIRKKRKKTFGRKKKKKK